jgi:hypothetical protein
MVLLVLLTVPLLLVKYPPLQDLPNHLARILILKASPDHPLLRYYELNWQLLPNLAFELFMVPATAIFSLATSAKLFLAFATLVWLCAPFALHYALYRRVSIIPLVGGLTLFGAVYQKGFMSYLLGSGLVVAFLALWIASSHRPLANRIVLGLLASSSLFLCHLFVFGMFAIAVSIWELLDGAAQPRPVPTLLKRKAPLLVGSFTFPAIAFLFFSPTSGASSPEAVVLWPSDLVVHLGYKLYLVSTLFPVGRAGSAISFMAFVVLFAAAAWQKPPGMNGRVLAICISLLICFLILPPKLMSGANVDWRLLAPLSLIVAGAINLSLSASQASAAALCVVLLCGAQSYKVATSWLSGEKDFADFTRALQPLPAGSRLYYAAVNMPYSAAIATPSKLHLAGLAAIEHSLVVPTLFAYRTQQPIAVRQPFEVRHKSLEPFSENVTDIPWDIVLQDFDFVLLASPTEIDIAPWMRLRRLRSEGLFHLYGTSRESGVVR